MSIIMAIVNYIFVKLLFAIDIVSVYRYNSSTDFCRDNVNFMSAKIQHQSIQKKRKW